MKLSRLTFIILLSLGSLRPNLATSSVPQLPPNELGEIMGLEYHQIGPKEGRWRRDPDNFRKDLADLYAQGYALTNLNDVLDGNIRVPAGKSPVVLTFDDGAVGQFGLTTSGDFDPDTAVGMITEFARKHPGFGVAGTFYLNPDRQRSTTWSSVLRKMVAAGFELGNHTVTHPHLSGLSRAAVEQETAGLLAWLQLNVSGYNVRSMALPHGIYPRQDGMKKESWVQDGEYRGVRYHHDALLEVGSNPSASPFSFRFDPLHIPRVQVWGEAKPGEPVFSLYYQRALRNPSVRFVSDGDPTTITVPRGQAGKVARSRFPKLTVVEAQ